MVLKPEEMDSAKNLFHYNFLLFFYKVHNFLIITNASCPLVGVIKMEKSFSNLLYFQSYPG